MGSLPHSFHMPLPDLHRDELDALFQLCRTDQWDRILRIHKDRPWIALHPMIMDNHIVTTILHQAITSKGDTDLRAQVIINILKATPQAAAMKNGYGSLPLHVIAQRNTKMDSATKERLIFVLVQAYKDGLKIEGGVGKRTPLHIIFTDYISPQVTKIMIENGREACFMKDKKGYLPAHIACSRHCSPEKLRMLLSVNPTALYDKTNRGETLLTLATSTATKAHPNYALIDELNRQLAAPPSALYPPPAVPFASSEDSTPSRGIHDRWDSQTPRRDSIAGDKPNRKRLVEDTSPEQRHFGIGTVRPMKRRRHKYVDDKTSPSQGPSGAASSRLDPVDLLLHFSRHGSPQTAHPVHNASQYAEV